MSINETATCAECGITVQYVDQSYWPWHGIDGSDMCRSKENVRWPHRVGPAEAQEILAAYEARTGLKARHQ